MLDIMSEAYGSSIGHCSVSIGHWEHKKKGGVTWLYHNIMMLILDDYCRTISMTFLKKMSDIHVKTLDISGCPTVFQKHCYTNVRYKIAYFYIWVYLINYEAAWTIGLIRLKTSRAHFFHDTQKFTHT